MKDRDLLVVIDDDTDDHEIFNIAISEIKRPLKCLFFPDCEQAMAHFRELDAETPSLVFIDLNLPRVNGRECLQNLQTISTFDHPQVIIYSGSVPDHLKQGLEDLGVDSFMEKSGSISTLVGQITDLLNNGKI